MRGKPRGQSAGLSGSQTDSEPKRIIVGSEDTNSFSVLEAVARHESDLKARLAQAAREAKCVLDAARAETAALLEKDEQRVAEEIALIRSDAEIRCERERLEAEQACSERLEQLRASAYERASEIIAEVVDFVLPPRRDSADPKKDREVAE